MNYTKGHNYSGSQVLAKDAIGETLAQAWNSPRWLLSIASFVIVVSEFRWGVSGVALLAPILLLRYLRITPTGRPLLWLFGALFLAYTVAVAKIATGHIPILMSPMFGLPIAIMHFGGYVFFHWVKAHRGYGLALLAFPVAGVVCQWLIGLTPASTWGVSAYLFIDNLPLAQSLSLVGMAGLNLLFLWFAACAEAILSEGWNRSRFSQLTALVFVYLFLNAWGNWRLDQPFEVEQAVAAGIKTDWHVSMGLLDEEGQQLLFNSLAEKTVKAAQSGAQIVVWAEVATMVRPEGEAELLRKLDELATANKIHLVAGYAVLLENNQYANKYQWLTPTGDGQNEYLKRHPVPGEPAIKGTSLPTPVATPLGLASGAICFDFDFPEEALSRARQGVDFVALPSSDWKGIDPIHTQMAAFRSIEGGFSTLRTTNLGLTAGINPYGQMVARMDHYDHSDGIMLVRLPTEGVNTIYSQIGDLLVYLCMGMMLLCILRRPNSAKQH